MKKLLKRAQGFRPTRMQTIIAAITAALIVLASALAVYSTTASASSITHQGSGILDLDKTLLQAEGLHQETLSGEDETVSAEGEGKSLCFVAVQGEQVTNSLACGVVLRNGAMSAKYETLPISWEPAERAEGAFIGSLVSETFTGKSSVQAGSELRRPDGKQAISPDALNSSEEEAEQVEVLPSSPEGQVLKEAEIVEGTSREITHTTVRTPGAERTVRIGTAERVSTPNEGERERVSSEGERIIFVSADVLPITPAAEAGNGEQNEGENGGEGSEGDAPVPGDENSGSSEGDAGVQPAGKPSYEIEIEGIRSPIEPSDLDTPLAVVVPDESNASLIVEKDEVEQEISLTDSADKPLGKITSSSPAANALYKRDTVSIESTSRMEYDAFLTEGSVSLAMNNVTVAAHTDDLGWANGGEHQWLIGTIAKVGGHPREAPAYSFSPEMMTWEHSSAKADGVSLGVPRVVRDTNSTAVALVWAAPLEMEEVSIIARPSIEMEKMEDFEGISFTVPEHIAEPFDFTVTRSSASEVSDEDSEDSEE